MTKRERFNRLLSRWLAVEKCLEALDASHRAIFVAYHSGEPLPAIAKRSKKTQHRVAVILEKAEQRLTDMLIDDEDE